MTPGQRSWSDEVLLDPARVLLEYSTEAAYIAEVDGQLLWLSPTVTNILGWPVDDLLRRRIRDLIVPAQQPRAAELRALLMESGPGAPAITTEPLLFRTASGAELWCTVTARLIFDGQGTAVGITGSMRDVDGLVRSRERATEAHRHLLEALDAQMDPWAILVAVRDETGRPVDFVFEEANSAAERFHGLGEGGLEGRTVLQVVGPVSGSGDVSTAAEVLASGETTIWNDQWSYVVDARGGPPTWLDIRISPVDADRVLYTWRIVTDRYLARAELADAFALLRSVIDAQLEPHAILRAVRGDYGVIVDFAYEDCNEAAAEFEGQPREALIGAGLRQLSPSMDDAEIDIRDCTEVLTSGQPKVQNDNVTGYLTRDGRPIVVDLRIVPIDSERVSYTWRDVTDRYENQRRLGESEERFRLLAETSSDVVYLAGLDGRMTWVAPTLTRSLGWRPSDWLGHLPGDFLHPDERASGPGHAEYPDAEDARRVRASDGSYRWMTVQHEAVYDSNRALVGVTGSMKDVDQLVRARMSILEAHDILRSVMDNQVDPHVIAEAVRGEAGDIVDFRFVDVNAAAARFEGIPREGMQGRTFLEVYASQREALEDIGYCAQVLVTGEPLLVNDDPTDYVDVQGRQVMVDIRIVAIGVDRVSYQWRDVTDRFESLRQLALSEDRFRLLAENMSDVVALVTNGAIEWISPSVARVLGWSGDELLGRPMQSFVHPDDLAALTSGWEGVAHGPVPRARFRVQDKAGTWRWMESAGTVVATGDEQRVVLGARLVDTEVEAQSRLERMARHDELTGLVNRHEVFAQLARALGPDSRTGHLTGVLFLDLDGFKEVNDRYGHSGGDSLLRTLAARLALAVRSDDVVARIGGDEFLVVLRGVRDLDDAVRIAHQIREAVSEPVEVPGGVARVSASIGVCIARPGQSLDDLVAEADRAMYEAKSAGKDAVVAVPLT